MWVGRDELLVRALRFTPLTELLIALAQEETGFYPDHGVLLGTLRLRVSVEEGLQRLFPVPLDVVDRGSRVPRFQIVLYAECTANARCFLDGPRRLVLASHPCRQACSQSVEVSQIPVVEAYRYFAAIGPGFELGDTSPRMVVGLGVLLATLQRRGQTTFKECALRMRPQKPFRMLGRFLLASHEDQEVNVVPMGLCLVWLQRYRLAKIIQGKIVATSVRV